ncbi:MAG: DUF808 family protein, partial [Hydrogenophaga sp.]|nr:DUF808 family protein [Hydrogenophaga sp.]
GILSAAPWLMKTLSVVGTAAMFLVGGGILLHGIPALGHAVEGVVVNQGWLGVLVSNLAGAATGLVAGGLAVLLFTGFQRLRGQGTPAAH